MGDLEPSSSQTEALRAQYCPPLDDALFYAIVSDHQLPQDRATLTSVLDRLKATAIEQEDAEFDPSGTGAPVHLREATDTSRSCPEDVFSNDVTSITTGLSDFKWDESDSLEHDLDNSSIEKKTAWLQHVFPDIPKRELASVLESHGGSLDKAVDDLLNLSFLNQGLEEGPEEVPVLKGVDGFAEDVLPQRKGRKKRKPRTNESSRASSASSSPYESECVSTNVWATMSEDVGFICSRTKLQPQVVRSIYHSNGARLASTIRALAITEGMAYTQLSDVDPILDLQIAEFQSQFEHVPKSQMYGLLSLARNIPSAAQELLQAMSVFENAQNPGKLHDAAQYAPLDLTENRAPDRTSTATSAMAKPPYQASAASFRIAASQSFDQAGAAYKRSKSDRLYGGVAAHYSEIGRERIRAAKEAKAAEADLLVAEQSSPTVLDLHGVTVQDAVRIGSMKTQSWWDGLGDAKYASGGGGPARVGFKIVTGVGTHSKNHAPRIGPAVSKMLMREGWKVEIGHGELLVTGKSRR
ncbi:uncharacterized protein A1O5_03956 [Cladophialophora psammophila CBS 110553]|uniref:Smr domain-containing protein n=1 Tax=Cladophialophora psammophila CBS 110553 TaxID=1182543 RepID=W9WXX1_9EURO|nr:uncharacterized protein A1O5_03956 [Cladophialophora psammophila CBS 110553]EXJ72808.1 hypothetical protein A1O5_03956 [Cladophialophora psammophila CBS 110553]